jgi:hypothetical protein
VNVEQYHDHVDVQAERMFSNMHDIETCHRTPYV